MRRERRRKRSASPSGCSSSDRAATCVPFFAAADMFVLPSAYEANALVVLEALACGLPVVATRVGFAPEIIVDGDNGYLVDRDAARDRRRMRAARRGRPRRVARAGRRERRGLTRGARSPSGTSNSLEQLAANEHGRAHRRGIR